MTIRGVGAALVIANDIATDLLVVIVVVGVQTHHDHTPICALGRQARTRLRRTLTVAFVRTVGGVHDGRRNEVAFVERHCCMGCRPPSARTGRPSRRR